jgi:hypothetical protein
LSAFNWRGSSVLADADPAMRRKTPAKSKQPPVQLVLTNKHNSINTVGAFDSYKAQKLLKAAI